MEFGQAAGGVQLSRLPSRPAYLSGLVGAWQNLVSADFNFDISLEFVIKSDKLQKAILRGFYICLIFVFFNMAKTW